MYDDISDILRALLDRCANATEAEHEFARMLRDDSHLKRDYAEWCDAQGYDTKTGYQDFIDEMLEDQDSIWDNLNE